MGSTMEEVLFNPATEDELYGCNQSFNRLPNIIFK